MKKTLIVLCNLFLIMACGKKEVEPTPTPDTSSLQAAALFPVGAAIDPNLLKSNTLYREILIKEYSSITAENALKWGAIRPNQATFNFNDADYIVDFAVANKKRMFGHTLLWHSYNPAWLTTFQGDSTAFENLMKTHIQTVVSRYKGKIAAWDVVNEAFNDDGNLRTESIWYQKLGKDYIARAFKYANEADPNAILFYNDYGQEANAKKLNGILAMVKDLKTRKIPIHGIGLQMHIGLNTDNNGILLAMGEYYKTGLKVHISELDINVSNWTKNPSLVMNDDLNAKQNAKFYFVVNSYRTIMDKEQQFGITNWNVGDADSWLRGVIQKNEFPLLFDENYKKKPAYYGYLDGLYK